MHSARPWAAALLLLAAGAAGAANGVVLAGRMGTRALLVVDGRAHTVGVGEAVAGVRLLGWDVGPSGASLRPGDTLHLVLYWQALAAMDSSYTVFTHLLSEDGRLGGQQDGIPGNGTLPTTTWLPGEVISDRGDLVLRRDAAPGDYRLAIGLYELASLQREPVLDAQGGVAGDQVWLQGRVFQIGAGN